MIIRLMKRKKIENYIFYDEKGFDFINEVEDDWIDNLFSDSSIGKNVYGSLDKKKIHGILVLMMMMI
jgi:hypothetical protein